MEKKPWKKNLLAIPPNIHAQLNTLESDLVRASCVVAIREQDIQAGLFAHLGISWEDGNPEFPKCVVPPTEIGRYSKRNRIGWEVVHKELPKEYRSWWVDAPNYGDSSKGYHTVTFTNEVYPRDSYPPRLLPILIECGYHNEIEQTYPFVFTVDEVLDKKSPSFLDDLLFDLNLLQENTGNHGVQKSDATLEEYLDTLYVAWEILPVGEREETYRKIMSGIQTGDPQLREQVMDRYDFLFRLKPHNFIRGTNQFRRYFGAQFADDLVVFENLEYGNAIYVMFEDWEETSKKSRIELLRTTNAENVHRIPHTKTWKRRLRRFIQIEKLKRGM